MGSWIQGAEAALSGSLVVPGRSHSVPGPKAPEMQVLRVEHELNGAPIGAWSPGAKEQ